MTAEEGKQTWRTLWKIGHKTYPWFSSTEEDERTALEDRVSQFYENLINPLLKEQKPVNILLSINSWNELIAEGTIGDYFTPVASEIQVETGKLGAIDNVTFWTDVFSDAKATDEAGNPLQDSYAILSSPLEIEMNEPKVVPAIGEMLEASTSQSETITSVNDLLGQMEHTEEPEEIGPMLETHVSFIFGDKKEQKENRAILNSHFNYISWTETLKGANKKDKDSNVNLQFVANSIPGEYDLLCVAIQALISEGSTKIIFKQGDAAKKTINVGIERAISNCNLSRGDNSQDVIISVTGVILDKE